MLKDTKVNYEAHSYILHNSMKQFKAFIKRCMLC